MVSSDDAGTRRTRRIWIVPASVAAVLLGVAVIVALVLGVFWWGIWQSQEHGRAQNVDAVEETFRDNRAGFDATASYITELAESEPDAIRIGWPPHRICVIDAALEKTCRDATEAEETLEQGVPGAAMIEWQAKDDGRVFFMFNQEEPPANNLMFDPQERDAKDFAKKHGFSWERDLGDGWSIPGSIPNDDDADAMWVVRWE